jgi:hypothetical protein
VLACVAQNSVSLYSVPQLASTASGASAPPPLQQLTVESAVKQVAWCGDAQAPHWYLVVTEEHSLLAAKYPGQVSEVAPGVQAACWAPTGHVLAASKGRRVEVVDAQSPGAPLASMEVEHPEGEGGPHTPIATGGALQQNCKQHISCRGVFIAHPLFMHLYLGVIPSGIPGSRCPCHLLPACLTLCSP